ncbi:MAG: hypothetical protein AAFQ53_11405 [Bacteroidota bacterium]
MYPFLRPFLNKGGAGPSLSRAESAERLLPLVERHLDLHNAYEVAIASLDDATLADTLRGLLKRGRVELAKLNETVYSLGGTPPHGVDREMSDYDLGATDAHRVYTLDAYERAYRDALTDEIGTNHQLRTLAIIENNRRGSEERLTALRASTSRLPRPVDLPELPDLRPGQMTGRHGQVHAE